jgi:hypothetical protein
VTAETCHRCGGSNVTWFAPSPLWNLVMRGNDINGDALHDDLVCVPCFVLLAAEAGVEGVWRVSGAPGDRRPHPGAAERGGAPGA